MQHNKLFFTIFLSCFLSVFMITESKAQNIFDDTIFLRTQAEIKIFGDKKYTDITGSLIILGPASGSDIMDLSPLSTLTTVGGVLTISNTLLTNLNGLEKLTSVGENINIYNNSKLENLDVLSGLTYLGGIQINVNSVLKDISGLSGIISVDGEIVIAYNPALESLTGLDNITYVDWFITIQSNAALISLNGLNALTSVGSLFIVYNPALENLSGLNALESVHGYFQISDNEVLTNLDALSNINFIGEYFGKTLDISNNPMLVNFCGLYPVFSEGTLANGEIQIAGYTNPTPEEIEVIFADCTPLTPEEMIAELITSVDLSSIHKGTKNSLTSSLDNALKSLGKRNTGAAIDKLQAFINKVEAQSGKKIDDGTADTWIIDAQAIIDAIETSLAKNSGVESLTSSDVKPETYSLNQNYPNPFNPTTSVSYSIPSDGYVTLSIYDALGKEVAVLDNGFRTAGNYSHTFDASALSSGMYFYTIRSGDFVQTKKMLLMK